METLRHKARITAEAQFDYEYCVCPTDRKIPKWRDVLISISPIKAMLYLAKTESARRKLIAAKSVEGRYRGTDTARLNLLFDAIEKAADGYDDARRDPEYTEMLNKAFEIYEKMDVPFRNMCRVRFSSIPRSL
jgi:hypothetical protein